MARAPSKADKDLRKEALERYKICEDWWAENQKRWKEDVRFCIPGNQWPEKIRKLRESENRPCLEVDKVNQYVHQVVNDGRQNRAAVKVRPVDSGADEETADAFQGLIRSIFDRSNGDEAFDTALEHAVRGGFGFVRILTEYASDSTFNQDIKLARVRNPLTVMLAPHQRADGSDAMYGFVVDEIPKDEYKRKYPKAQVSDWSLYPDGWATKDTVRICEYFYVVEVPRPVFLLDDGTTCTEDEYKLKVENLAEGEEPPKIEEQREIPTREVKWCRLSGAEILEKNDWMGKYIPLIPVYGNELDIDGKLVLHGLVRPARDAQTLYNFSRTSFAEVAGFSTKAPWIAPAEAVADYKEDWANPNGNQGLLRYRAFTDDGQSIPPPQRTPPVAVPAVFAEDMQLSEHDIQAAMGMYAANIGQPSNEKSGRAIMARQREGDTATFHFQDNQNRALRFCGRQLVDLAPKIYDSKRVLRLLGEDGSVSEAHIDPEQETASFTEGVKSIYNLGVGTYDVSVAAGPSYTTKRQEAADAAIELTRANPSMWQTHGDLIVKMQDWPYAEEFAERSKMALPPPIQQQIAAKESGNAPDPKIAAVVQQANQALGQAAQRIQAAEAGIQQRDQALAESQQRITELEQALKNKSDENLIKASQADTQQYVAETERAQVVAPAMSPQDIAAIVNQTVQAILNAPTPGVPVQ